MRSTAPEAGGKPRFFYLVIGVFVMSTYTIADSPALRWSVATLTPHPHRALRTERRESPSGDEPRSFELPQTQRQYPGRQLGDRPAQHSEAPIPLFDSSKDNRLPLAAEDAESDFDGTTVRAAVELNHCCHP